MHLIAAAQIIPNNMPPVHFQLMPTTVLQDPLTTEQQASLSLPDLDICVDYINWVRSDPLNDHLPYGFTIEKKEDWLKTYKEEGYAKLKRSFLKHGHPAENWIYTDVDTDKKDTLIILNYILLLMTFMSTKLAIFVHYLFKCCNQESSRHADAHQTISPSRCSADDGV